MIYLVGSLKHDRVREVAEALREAGHEVFDDWHASGPEADLHWQRYEQERGRNYAEALRGSFAWNGYSFDRGHLDKCNTVIAVAKQFKLPGRSSIAELTYAKHANHSRTKILLDGEPEEWDLMLLLVVDPGDIYYSLEKLVESLK